MSDTESTSSLRVVETDIQPIAEAWLFIKTGQSQESSGETEQGSHLPFGNIGRDVFMHFSHWGTCELQCLDSVLSSFRCIYIFLFFTDKDPCVWNKD